MRHELGPVTVIGELNLQYAAQDAQRQDHAPRFTNQLHTQLGADMFDVTLAEGRAMSLEQANAYALEHV